MCCCSNCCNTSFNVFVILSPISSISPLVSTMGSRCICLSDSFFFHFPPCYSCMHFLNMEGVISSSPPPPPCSDSSCSSVWWEANFWLSSASLCSHSTYILSAHSFSIQAFSATIVATSFLLFSTNVHMACLAFSFCFYATKPFVPVLVPTSNPIGMHHSHS